MTCDVGEYEIILGDRITQTKHFDFYTEIHLSFRRTSCAPSFRFSVLSAHFRLLFLCYPSQSHSNQYLNSVLSLSLILSAQTLKLKHVYTFSCSLVWIDLQSSPRMSPSTGEVLCEASLRLPTDDNPFSMRLITSDNLDRWSLKK